MCKGGHVFRLLWERAGFVFLVSQFCMPSSVTWALVTVALDLRRQLIGRSRKNNVNIPLDMPSRKDATRPQKVFFLGSKAPKVTLSMLIF